MNLHYSTILMVNEGDNGMRKNPYVQSSEHALCGALDKNWDHTGIHLKIYPSPMQPWSRYPDFPQEKNPQLAQQTADNHLLW